MAFCSTMRICVSLSDLPRHPPKVPRRHLILHDYEDFGGEAVVIAGAVCGVVAEVGGEALSHGAWADGPALPFQEECLDFPAPLHHDEGIGIDGPDAPVVAEVS